MEGNIMAHTHLSSTGNMHLVVQDNDGSDHATLSGFRPAGATPIQISILSFRLCNVFLDEPAVCDIRSKRWPALFVLGCVVRFLHAYFSLGLWIGCLTDVFVLCAGYISLEGAQ
jgi:hypothetical protein